MIINFISELNNAVSHSEKIWRKYNIKVSCDKILPEEYEQVTLLFDEDLDKIRAICNAADELDKRNRELEKLVKESGLEDSNSYYYPLGGGSLF